jgi:cell division septation protein DedD
MNSEDNTNLDLLDLDGDTSDSLPEVAFTTPRPKKPWLLLGIGLVVIALATYIIVRTVGGNSSSTVEIDLDAAPEVIVDGGDIPMPQPMPDVNPQPLPMPPVQVAPVAQPQPEVVPQKTAPVVTEPEPNVRVVEDRREVVFNPEKPVVEPKPVVKKAEVKPVAKKAAQKPAVKKAEKTSGGAAWYVQFGSYATRDAANAAGSKMRAAHSSLFAGKQFVVLASVLKDGRTTYRLRVAFNNVNDANGFCRNAKSDGLDCYVAK